MAKTAVGWVGSTCICVVTLLTQLWPSVPSALASTGTSGVQPAVVWRSLAGVPWQFAMAGKATRAHLLVVCVQFAGKPAVRPLSTFSHIYFGKEQSVADYYQQVSFGQFQLTGDVIGDPLKPGHFLQLPHTESYYAGKDNGTGSPYPHDDNQLVADVIFKLYAEHFNFAPYLQGNRIPYLAIVYSGFGADVAPQNTKLLWPVENTLDSPAAVAVAGGDAVRPKYLYVSNYDLVPELGDEGTPPTLGVFAHEFGHLLGLDDLYDTGTGSGTGQGDGPWSLMASGNWNGFPQGSEPAELDPYSRSLLGFAQPIKITESITGLRLPPLEQQPIIYELDPAGAAIKDFFLIDNVESRSYDVGLPGYGVMIWHVDGVQGIPGSYDWDNNVLNTPSQNKTHHNDEQVVEAGGNNLSQSSGGLLDDPYPSMKGVDSFTATSKPANTLWNGHSLGISLTHISVGKDGYASLDVVDAQSGSALTILRPATGVDAYQGQSLNLRAQWWTDSGKSDVSAKASWYTNRSGISLQGHAVALRQPGYVFVAAFYHHLTALLELRVIALRQLRTVGAIQSMRVGQRAVVPSLAARYADGKTILLSGSASDGVSWRSLSPGLLLLEGGVVKAIAKGVATVEADYGGQSIRFSVVID